ncbi:MAG: hypothetical protein NXH83_07120 [Rhodobacteraceae bacterium]|nr:hypothetical protein [Paracoccaceae bacterium]
MSIQTAQAGAARPSVSLALFAVAVALLAVAGVALAVKTWGLVALGLTALATVPVMFVVLILLTLGK